VSPVVNVLRPRLDGLILACSILDTGNIARSKHADDSGLPVTDTSSGFSPPRAMPSRSDTAAGRPLAGRQRRTVQPRPGNRLPRPGDVAGRRPIRGRQTGRRREALPSIVPHMPHQAALHTRFFRIGGALSPGASVPAVRAAPNQTTIDVVQRHAPVRATFAISPSVELTFLARPKRVLARIQQFKAYPSAWLACQLTVIRPLPAHASPHVGRE